MTDEIERLIDSVAEEMASRHKKIHEARLLAIEAFESEDDLEKQTKYAKSVSILDGVLAQHNDFYAYYLRAKVKLAREGFNLRSEGLLDDIRSDIVKTYTSIEEGDLPSLMSFDDFTTFFLMTGLIKRHLNLERLNRQMQSMLQQYSHTLANSIIPERLALIIDRLKDNPDLRDEVAALVNAYDAERFIRLNGELLRLRFASDDPAEFRQIIRSDRLDMEDLDRKPASGVINILSQAAVRVISSILSAGNPIGKNLFQGFEAISGQSFEEIKKEFERIATSGEEDSILGWLSKVGFLVDIAEVSERWQQVQLLKGGYAEALLCSYFSELFLNAIKHGEQTEKYFLAISFSNRVIDGQTFLVSTWKNQSQRSKHRKLGNAKGLSAIAEDLGRLNGIPTEQCVSIELQGLSFKVALSFRADLLIRASLDPGLAAKLAGLFKEKDGK